MNYLDRVITTNERVIASTPENHPHRALYLNSVVNTLQSRFERTNSMDDLDWATTTSEQAVASTPDDYPNHPIRLNNLGLESI